MFVCLCGFLWDDGIEGVSFQQFCASLYPKFWQSVLLKLCLKAIHFDSRVTLCVWDALLGWMRCKNNNKEKYPFVFNIYIIFSNTQGMHVCE